MRIVLKKFLDFKINLIVSKIQINLKFKIAAGFGVYLNFLWYFISNPHEYFRFLSCVGICIIDFWKIVDFQYFVILVSDLFWSKCFHNHRDSYRNPCFHLCRSLVSARIRVATVCHIRFFQLHCFPGEWPYLNRCVNLILKWNCIHRLLSGSDFLCIHSDNSN